MMYIKLSCALLFIVFGLSCNLSTGNPNSNGESNNKYTAGDVRLFKNSPAWEIAKAIEKDDTAKLKRLLIDASPSTLNYQERTYGQTMIMWAIYSYHYDGFKILVESGADVNIKAYDSSKAINWAAGVYETSDYLKVLLTKNVDVNYIADNIHVERLRTPLIHACLFSLENVKLLVERGANINYFHFESYSNSPLLSACMGNSFKIVKYLIMEKNVELNHPLMLTMEGDSLYISDLLRTFTFPLDSKDYKDKMEVVDFLKTKGIDYKKSAIPAWYYKKFSKEYLDNY